MSNKYFSLKYLRNLENKNSIIYFLQNSSIHIKQTNIKLLIIIVQTK